MNIYKEILNGEREKFPVIFKRNLNCFRAVSRYLFEDLLNYNLNDIFENLTEDLLIKYKIVNIVKGYFKSHYEYIKFVYPEEKIFPWSFKLGSRNYIKDDGHVREAVELLINTHNITINDVYDFNLNREWVSKLKLDSIFYVRFGCSFARMFEWYYNNYSQVEFDPDKLRHKNKFYLTKDSIIEKIKNDFINLGFNEYIKSAKNDSLIVDNFTDQYLKNISHNIHRVLDIRSRYQIFKLVFPNYDLKEWEFDFTSSGYWREESNRKKALLELIERNGWNKHDIIFNLNNTRMKELGYAKFNSVCGEYYDYQYYKWLDSVIPNTFDNSDFTSLISYDGYRMKSYSEVDIHTQLKENNSIYELEYIENKDALKFYNAEFNEAYIPDWIINNNIIVEYFGWYLTESQWDRHMTYIEKANRKIEFYNSLDDYKFIALFPEDKNSVNQKVNRFLHSIKGR